MQLTPQTFSINGFVKPEHSVTLKSVSVEETEDGMKPTGKYGDAVELKTTNGNYGAFLVNPLSEEDRANFDTYFISGTNPDNRGARKPVAVLRRKSAGAEEAEHICGLFLRHYDDGSSALIGTDKENKKRYGIFLNKAESAQKIAVNQ